MVSFLVLPVVCISCSVLIQEIFMIQLQDRYGTILFLYLLDTASREEVRHMYPDPPTDLHSLDIQQQALLREQQRKIRLMTREQEHGQTPPYKHTHSQQFSL